jgi:putative Ca2+/H+ antiporter (TMEM165/GDT1 family)
VHRHTHNKGLKEYMIFGAMLSCEEWGDKSQLTAIALAANYDSLSVIIGGSFVRIINNHTIIGICLSYFHCISHWTSSIEYPQ